MQKVKFHPSERIDLTDVEALSDNFHDEHQRVFEDLVVGDGKMRIIDSFNKTTVGADVFRVTLGKAIFAEVRNAGVRYGQLISDADGLATQDISFAGAGAATYDIFVRFTLGDGDDGNRAFWDVAGSIEVIQLVPTRKKPGWEITRVVQGNSPGTEWYRIWSVVWDGAAFGTITDRRVYLFEGDAAASFAPDWGGGNDRNADRATYGVKTLERFASAVLQCIKDIKSASGAWYAVPTERLDQKVSRNGDLTLNGNYKITGNLTMAGNILANTIGDDVGDATKPFDAHLRIVTIYNQIVPDATGRLLGSATERFTATLESIAMYGAITNASGANKNLGASGATARFNIFGGTGDFTGVVAVDGGIQTAGITNEDLGSNADNARFNVFAATITIAGNIVTDGTANRTIGVDAANQRFSVNAANLVVNGTSSFTGNLTVTGEVASAFVPATNGNDLGNATKRWDAHIELIHAVYGGRSTTTPASNADVTAITQNKGMAARGSIVWDVGGVPNMDANDSSWFNATIGDGGAGIVDVTFDIAIETPYQVLAQLIHTPGAGTYDRQVFVTDKTATGFKIRIIDIDSEVYVDDIPVDFVVFGKPDTAP